MFAKSSANVTTSEVKPSLYGEAGHTLIAYMVVDPLQMGFHSKWKIKSWNSQCF